MAEKKKFTEDIADILADDIALLEKLEPGAIVRPEIAPRRTEPPAPLKPAEPEKPAEEAAPAPPVEAAPAPPVQMAPAPPVETQPAAATEVVEPTLPLEPEPEPEPRPELEPEPEPEPEPAPAIEAVQTPSPEPDVYIVAPVVEATPPLPGWPPPPSLETARPAVSAEAPTPALKPQPAVEPAAEMAEEPITAVVPPEPEPEPEPVVAEAATSVVAPAAAARASTGGQHFSDAVTLLEIAPPEAGGARESALPGDRSQSPNPPQSAPRVGWSNPWLAWPAGVLATLAMTVFFIWVLVELFHL